VAPRSPAATSGLRDGDVVVKADGRAVHDIPDLSRAMREQDEAREVALEVMRERKARKVLLKW